tara:strand:- start:145 stop:678 length:534 start_codon:yes stop_codon:yes gene_type:complete
MEEVNNLENARSMIDIEVAVNSAFRSMFKTNHTPSENAVKEYNDRLFYYHENPKIWADMLGRNPHHYLWRQLLFYKWASLDAKERFKVIEQRILNDECITTSLAKALAFSAFMLDPDQPKHFGDIHHAYSMIVKNLTNILFGNLVNEIKKDVKNFDAFSYNNPDDMHAVKIGGTNND